MVLAQARDRDGNVQPLDAAWNPRGYCNNQVQRVSGAAR
jgi:sulfite oxidase